MRRLKHSLHITALVLVLAVGSRAADGSARQDTLVIDTTAVQVVEPTPRVLSDWEWADVNLGRAIDLWLRYDQRGAAALLETIDVTPQSTYPDADRAAFLLAAAYLDVGDLTAFHLVADRAAPAPSPSPWREWIRYCRLVYPDTTDVSTDVPRNIPGADVLAATLLIERGRAREAADLLANASSGDELESVRLYMKALARKSAGDDTFTHWEELARRHPGTRLEADLVAAALLELAADEIERGGDGNGPLSKISADSRHAPRAIHVRAIRAIERGDPAGAEELLQQLLDEHAIYEGRRDVLMALGHIRMDRGDWLEALDYYESAEADWLYEYESLEHFENDEVLEEIWYAWEQPALWRNEIRLSPETVLGEIRRLAEASLDLSDTPSLDAARDMPERLLPHVQSLLETASWDRTDALRRHYPIPEDWDALRKLTSQRTHLESELARQEYVVAGHERLVARQLNYLRRGREAATASGDSLAAVAADLRKVLAVIDNAVARLDAVRDRTLAGIELRTREMAEGLSRDVIFTRALRHFYVEGPHREPATPRPDGTPAPGTVLDMEETLALLSQRYVTLFAEHYTAVINRSYEEIWEPRLTGDAHGLYNELIAQMERARSISAEIDSTMAAVADDPDLRAAELERDALAAELETAVRSEQDMRRRIAHEVAARGRVQLDGEREALDYHLCDASYELAVELATHPETAEDTTVVAPPRRRAITHLDAFLQRYPQSVARSETRYRLADLMLMQARDDFQIQMARFLDADPTADDLGNRALAPFVEYAPAIALYESIIADDPEFPHMDAVLFNLGMILSDDGRPEAREYLEQLVQRYPDSPDCQEAWLRLGGDRFDREDYAGCINYLETAATGDDATFTAIALYKLGWAHFEQDHFGQSTDTFRKLMDHYADHPDLAADMDLRDEAEEYLVHSLGRSGGAQAYADYFGMIGPRPYEQDILLSLGHLMRNVSLYKEAAECDLLWLEKYPEHEKTLAVVERLVDTYKNGNEADLARETKLRAAPRFLPGGEWYEANSDSELRADGIAFAQSAFRENAAYFHRLAREGDDPAAWRSALGSYELYLTHWPDIDDAHQVHYLAGEAAVRIGDYGASLGHFEAAALSDSLELARDAAWQRVAVADTWYRNTQPSQTENGTDSLAALLLNAGHDFIDRFGTDERATDIIWRQANIAYAHEWNTAAAASFALFAQRYPNDPRASVAIRMSGDAHYRHGEYAAAGNAYTHALDMARTAGSDSLAAELEKTIPLCYYKHAEQIVAADSTSGEREAAPLFDRVAREWPRFQYADIALYRAGLGYAADERYGEAIAAWERILEGYPQSEYARDSAIQIALTYDRSGNKTGAAMAYERFSEKYRDDDDAPEALLKAIDLLVEAGDESGAENMRSTFLTRFPGETHAVMEIRASRAAAALASVTAGTTTISALLAPGSDASASNLTAYLTLAEQHPDLATPSILAQVDFLKGEKTYVEYESLRLTQPLPDAIEVKKKKLEELLALYQKSAERGVTEYARASAYRIGAALVEFGDALMESERPDGLSGDDLYAYDDVIAEQSWEFYDRGTDVWSDMLKQTGKTGEDPGGWLVVTREALWPRLAQRFLYKPEIEYPLVLADPPQRTASK